MPERRGFCEICEDRYQVRSTILTSQLRSRSGTNRSAIPRRLTASSTGSCPTPSPSRCAATLCARIARTRMHSAQIVGKRTTAELEWLPVSPSTSLVSDRRPGGRSRQAAPTVEWIIPFDIKYFLRRPKAYDRFVLDSPPGSYLNIWKRVWDRVAHFKFTNLPRFPGLR